MQDQEGYKGVPYLHEPRTLGNQCIGAFTTDDNDGFNEYGTLY